MLGIIERHRDRVIERAILPRTRWKPGELVGEVAPEDRGRLARNTACERATNSALRPQLCHLARPTTMRAADALCEALEAEGVEHVFGIPGGANLPTYDALYDADLTHIQARHEQGAGHAAEGYAKASGGSAWRWRPPAPGRPTWSPRSPTR